MSFSFASRAVRFFIFGVYWGPPRSLPTPHTAELKAEKAKASTFPQIHDSTLLLMPPELAIGIGLVL
jgi:hypothetical protein